MTRTLLVPLDGSPAGETVLPWAAALARAGNLSLVLVRVVHWPVPVLAGGIGEYLDAASYETLLNAEQDSASSYLEEIRQRLAADGLAVEATVLSGAPADGILDLADDLGAAAIAMSTHGHGGMARLVLGSVAEQVLRQTDVPLLLVRADAHWPAGGWSPSSMLVPLDGSALAERVLNVVRDLLSKPARLVLTRVVAPVELEIPGAESFTGLPDATATRSALDHAESYLGEVAESLRSEGWNVSSDVEVGRPADQILAAVSHHDAGLIAMSTHGYTGVERWVLGSVADQVMRRADRPVLLVSARALASRAVGPLRVRDLMTRDLVTVQEDEPLLSAIRKLLRHRVSGLPVLGEAGALVGVVTEHDILAWEVRQIQELIAAPGLDNASITQRLKVEPVSRVMSSPVVTIEESASLASALRVFLERGFRRLPVIDNARLVGILARADLLKALTAQGEAAVEQATGGAVPAIPVA